MSNAQALHTISSKISKSEKGAPNGVPVLDSNGDVPTTQLNITKSDVGLANVDNTADTDKPVSSATQTALNAKANSADAVSTNTANKIVLRDGSGNFSAGTITAGLSGNASTASTLATARTLTIGNTGKSFNGSANVAWSLSEIGAWGASNDGTGSGLDADMLDGLHASSFQKKLGQVYLTANASSVSFSGLSITGPAILRLNVFDAYINYDYPGRLVLGFNNIPPVTGWMCSYFNGSSMGPKGATNWAPSYITANNTPPTVPMADVIIFLSGSGRLCFVSEEMYITATTTPHIYGGFTSSSIGSLNSIEIYTKYTDAAPYDIYQGASFILCQA